jgi:hypothetical protein
VVEWKMRKESKLIVDAYERKLKFHSNFEETAS